VVLVCLQNREDLAVLEDPFYREFHWDQEVLEFLQHQGDQSHPDHLWVPDDPSNLVVLVFR